MLSLPIVSLKIPYNKIKPYKEKNNNNFFFHLLKLLYAVYCVIIPDRDLTGNYQNTIQLYSASIS